MKQFLTNILLLLIALLLAAIMIPIGFLITPIFVFVQSGADEAFNKIGSYFKGIAIVIDQTGNIVLEYAFNTWLIKVSGYQFGNSQETISSVLGKNLVAGTLSMTGLWLANLLDSIQSNHCINSINNNI